MIDAFHPAVRAWFAATFPGPTRPQRVGWPAIARGESTLILAPTGSGKTLAAFLWCLNRMLFDPVPQKAARCRVLYISPLKALAVDVERNLRTPLAGIAQVAAARGVHVNAVDIAIRTGDTPTADRARFERHPPDILITTPESLFLLLSSRARARLASVDTVIVDEIHALVPTKRGAHLALSLERLDALRAGARRGGPPLQRIGLSATQRPLDEVGRFLGGAEHRRVRSGSPTRRRSQAVDPGATLHEALGEGKRALRFRPVTVVDASDKKPLDLRVEVPVEDMARLEQGAHQGPRLKQGPGAASRASIWTSVYPRLLEHIRTHTSTLLFVNSRRLAERLSGALNDLAGEPLVRAHHGSLAREARAQVEEELKAGRIRALVATSSLELGIDMGAIDLVIQIEAPPSVASGLQRIGRAGHQAGAVSQGIIVPKFRGDLVACAAVTEAMREGRVEATAYPRNPLDVLAQHVVAMVGMEPWDPDDLFARIRQAAPYAELTRALFDGVLDMLSGRYPSDDFAELRPRLTWNRSRATLTTRDGALKVAIANAGTIPDRGLYGVFLAGAAHPVRVGELDEEMVFETPPGDVFTLGASSWRVEDITHDRVLVSPAPGEVGKMPFWHGDQVGRPAELGRAIGALTRELREVPPSAALHRLKTRHDLELGAAENLLRYLADQAQAGAIPDDRTIVIERCLDELGDWRVCVLSPFGGRIHAPWAMAVTALVRARTGVDVDVMWGDDGFVVRFPESERPPDTALLLPPAAELEGLLTRQIGSTSLFAARFREAAGRALLLPRRRPGTRTPLWRQRKRATDLLAVAARFGSFPIVLETYRELLRDHFDVPALVATLRAVEAGTLHVASLDTTTPSPFAASLLFNYVANYLYDGDAPLAERRAQALSIDQAQLRELVGTAELRDLLDQDAVDAVEHELQHLVEDRKARSGDALHDLLLRIGDLDASELEARSTLPDTAAVVAQLAADGRVIQVAVAGTSRTIAVEDAARYRDALGLGLPAQVPRELLEPVADAGRDLARRFARTHGPFDTAAFATRFGLALPKAETLLRALQAAGQLLEGEFRPGGTSREWVDPAVLQTARRRSLARLRHETEPLAADALGRFLVAWHGIDAGRQGLEALLDVIEQLQGAPLVASTIETEVLPARVADYDPSMLDTLLAAGEVTWVGIDSLGERNGRIALYLTDHVTRLRTAHGPSATPPGQRARAVLEHLGTRGASFFSDIRTGTGGGFPPDTADALWELVWAGLVTNDSWHPLRHRLGVEPRRRHRRPARLGFRSRREAPTAAEGRWSLVASPANGPRALAEWSAATAQQLLARHGIVSRETVSAEAMAGGFAPVYQALKAMEAAGRVRRGYFVAGLGGAQFATPAALEALRAHRNPPAAPASVALAATDPANPYGTVLRWGPLGRLDAGDAARPPVRVAGARVLLVDGAPAGYLHKGGRELRLMLPEDEPRRIRVLVELVCRLKAIANSGAEGERGALIADINGIPATAHPDAVAFVADGFAATGGGLQLRASA